MMFTNDILKVYRNQALKKIESSTDNLDFFVHSEKLELKDTYKQIVAQQLQFDVSDIVTAGSFYRATVKGELLAKVRHIFNTIGHKKDEKAIINDISRLLNKESEFIDTDSFIEKLYYIVVNQKRFSRKSFYKYYVIVVRKLIRWKQEIFKILSLKVAYKILITLLSNKIRILTKKVIQVPIKFVMQEYFDLVFSLKEDHLIVNYCNQQLFIHFKGFNKNENRLYQIIMPPE